MIQVDNLSVSFGPEQVIQGLSFTVKPGEKVALAGPSGSGKSTIINLLMGFVHPFDGHVTVNGMGLSEHTATAIRRSMAWLPQELAFKVQTVSQLFYLPFTFRANRHLHPDRASVEAMLGNLLLDYSIMDKQLAEISGGQKQRIALASVLMLNRPLLLMDEPTSALDAESREAIISLISGLKSVTVLTSSHDAEWLRAMDFVIDIIK